jgi:flavin-dependent dehydrogenase
MGAEERRYMNKHQVADYIDSTPASVSAMTSRREVPHIKRGRRVLYDRYEIDAWLLQQAVPAVKQVHPSSADTEPGRDRTNPNQQGKDQ